VTDEAVLLCDRVEGFADPVAGSVAERCDRCGESVWVSPSSRRMREESGLALSPVCRDCFPAVVAELPPDEEVKVHKLTADQIEELVAEAKRRRGSE